MHQQIRVAQVVGRMMGGGVESTIMNYYMHMDHERVQFDFLVQEDSLIVPVREIERGGGRIIEIPSYKHLGSYIEQIERYCIESQPDIIHSNMNSLSVFPLYAAKRAGVRVRIAHNHSMSNPSEHVKTAVKTMLKPMASLYPTHKAACSITAGEWLFGKRAVRRGEVTIINNALDLDTFVFNQNARIALRQNANLNHGLVVGQVGRFCFQKNQKFMLEVLPELLKLEPNAHLVFIGVGDDEPMIRKLSRTRGLQDHVHFMGVQSNVAEWYSAFDVLAFPSAYEGLGMVAVEAQAVGCPVVMSTNVPSEAEIVPELATSVSLDSPSVWASQLYKKALEYRGKRYSQTALLRRAGYDISKEAEVLTNWYESICQASK